MSQTSDLVTLLPLLVGVLVAATIALGVWAFTPPHSIDERARRLDEQRNARTFAEGAVVRKRPESLGMAALKALNAKLLARGQALIRQNEKLQLKMIRAGIRKPYAHFYFMLAKVGFVLAGVGLVYLYGSLTGLATLYPLRHLALLALAAIVMFFVPNLWLKNRTDKRLQEVQRYWQDALDLLVICVESGLSMEASMRRVTQEIAGLAPVIAEEFVITVAELAFLPDRRDAYANLAQRVDLAPVKATTVALIQAEKQGAAIGRSLRAIAVSNREDLVASAEQKAASLGPKLTVPMIVFFLPVLFVIIIAPIFLNS